jgi:hypothetical protein
VQRDTPWRLLLASQIFVVLGVAALTWGLAPQLVTVYAEAGAELGVLTKVSLTSPVPMGLAGSCLVAALASLGAKRGTRLKLMSGALIVSGAVFVIAFVAAIWPLSH